MKKLIVGTAGAVVAAGLGLGLASSANAETPSPTPTPTATSSSTPGAQIPGQDQDRPERGGGKGDRGGRGFGVDTAALATKLGVDEAKLTTAIQAAREATKPTDTTKPTTEPTQAERDAARAARQAAFAKALASELGIDEAKVTAALNELQAAHEAEEAAADKTVLDQAVTDGKLTQAEADAVAKAVEAGVASVRGGGHGRH